MLPNYSLSKSFLILTSLLLTTSASLGVTRYVVKKGDSLYGLAVKFDTSVQTLRGVNGLNGSTIKVGDVILIPDSDDKELPIGRIEYGVVKGDTLTGIGKKFGVSVVDIKRENDLRSDSLQAGQRLVIPGSPREYVVRKGDTLSGIGNRFGVSVGDLKSANGLKGSNIRAEMRLNIPASATSVDDVDESIEYVVKKGDSLSLMAQKFGVSVADLKAANGIRGTVIRTGQVLIVPDQNDPRYGIVRVAKKFLGAPYKFGGTSTVKGIDCSAFVDKVFSFFDVNLPRTAREIYKVGEKVDLGELAVGDLVFFETYAEFPSHVGIYIGNDEFIHASSRAKMVTIDSINQRFYRNRYIGAKRVEL